MATGIKESCEEAVNIAIGMTTCNRLELTRRAIESLVQYNPCVIDFPWCIHDDASTDGTVDFLHAFLSDHGFNDVNATFRTLRVGVNCATKSVLNMAEQVADVVLHIQNDWRCSREIDFEGIGSFFRDCHDVGQVQCVHWKGKRIGHLRRRMTNRVTMDPVGFGPAERAGREILRQANYNWCDLPAFTRAGHDYYRGSNRRGKRNSELIRYKNFHDSGMLIYEMDNQPFWNMDVYRKNRTPGFK